MSHDLNHVPNAFANFDSDSWLRLYEDLTPEQKAEVVAWMNDNPDKKSSDWPGWPGAVADAYAKMHRHFATLMDVGYWSSTFSLKAKGLYLTAIAHDYHGSPFTLKDLHGKSPDGERTHRVAAQELEAVGFLERERVQGGWAYRLPELDAISEEDNG